LNLAKEINNANKNTAITVQGNLDVKEDVNAIIKEVLDAFPSIDLLINNASTFYPTPIDDISEEHWEKLVGSNLKGPLFLIQGLKQKLKESKGSIINITDTNLSKGVANYSIYSAAKAGLESITKGLARELAPEIKVNAIAPGAMLEPPDVTWTEEQKSKVIESIPLKRMGSEKDIAEAVNFLAHSQYITGQIIKVDGGRSL
jgi:pteridine reductase